MKNKPKGPENFLKDYKGLLIRQEWLEDIIKTYFGNCLSQEEFFDEDRGYYREARYKKETYRIYYRKEIVLENNREVIKYRFTTYSIKGEIIEMRLSI